MSSPRCSNCQTPLGLGHCRACLIFSEGLHSDRANNLIRRNPWLNPVEARLQMQVNMLQSENDRLHAEVHRVHRDLAKMHQLGLPPLRVPVQHQAAAHAQAPAQIPQAPGQAPAQIPQAPAQAPGSAAQIRAQNILNLGRTHPEAFLALYFPNDNKRQRTVPPPQPSAIESHALRSGQHHVLSPFPLRHLRFLPIGLEAIRSGNHKHIAHHPDECPNDETPCSDCWDEERGYPEMVASSEEDADAWDQEASVPALVANSEGDADSCDRI
jgi:hypothetical protein